MIAARAGRIAQARQLVAEVRGSRPAQRLPKLYRRLEATA